MNDIRLENIDKLDEMMSELSSRESMKILREAGNAIVTDHKILLKHWAEGQSTWMPASTAYQKWVKKKYGGSGKFEATGAARRSLTALPKKTGPVAMVMNRRFLSMTLYLRKMDGKTNVYYIAQRGRFKGIQTKSGEIVSKEKVREQNASNYKSYIGAKERGSKISLRGLASKKAKKLGWDGAQRVGKTERIITQITSSDVPQIQSALEKEIIVTLKMRGLAD